MRGVPIDSSAGEFAVVLNKEDQYSIWPVSHAVPTGWRPVGVRGSKEACLSYINEAWVDMRPLSVRGALTAALS